MENSLIIFPHLNGDNKNDNHSHSCFECESLKKLIDFKRQKRLTPCLELLEKHGFVGNTAIFLLSQVSLTWFSFGSDKIQGGQA